LSLCRVKIVTGCKHQIRVHAQSLGHPILNDDLYGTVKNRYGLALHCHSLAFLHPLYQTPVQLTAPPDKRFKKMWEKIQYPFQ
ncbi:MAG: RluA family pseudouridine synthase, partial [Erysipelotrichaceae bacterium]|nr:RluA family pseudouridine synthase [Erysipelotrichaceae bacterium]